MTGTGFAGDSSVAISMNPGSIALASTTTGANGQFSLVLTIPSSTPAGTYQVVATGLGADGSEQALVAQLTVTARGSTSRGSPTTSGGSPVSSGSSPGPSSAGRPGAGVGSGGSPATSKGGVAPKGGGAPSAANPIAATVTPTPPWSWETTAIVFASLLFVLGGTTLVLWSKRRRRLSGS